MCVCVYIYIYIYTHTYIHTHYLYTHTTECYSAIKTSLMTQTVKSLLQCRRPGFRSTVHGVAKSQTQLSNFTLFLFLSFSHKKKEIMPFAVIWMDLEMVMLSDISQIKINVI